MACILFGGLEGGVEDGAAHGIQYDIKSFAAGMFEHIVLHGRVFEIDRRGAIGLNQLKVFRVYCCINICSERFGNLHGNMANATGATMD